MRVLPILWGAPPTARDWELMSSARHQTGYEEKIMPAKALEGSPQPILAIGAHPDWLTDYAYVERTSDIEDLVTALEYCLDGGAPDGAGEKMAEQLSEWFGGEVKYVGTEEYPGPADR